MLTGELHIQLGHHVGSPAQELHTLGRHLQCRGRTGVSRRVADQPRLDERRHGGVRTLHGDA